VAAICEWRRVHQLEADGTADHQLEADGTADHQLEADGTQLADGTIWPRPLAWLYGIIPRHMLSFDEMNPGAGWIRARAAASVLVVLAVAVGCHKEKPEEKPAPVFRDEFSFYVLDPGVFEAVDPEYPTEKQFLILRSGDVEISCGIYRGAHVAGGAMEFEIARFATETILDENWLAGCTKWLLDASEVRIEGRWFYVATVLVRRDPERTARLTRIQQVVHRREIERFQDHVDNIVKLYYTVRDRDIYILTLSGSPEDVAAKEMDVRRLLANVRLSATEAVGGIDLGGSAQ
jgi:hypothetical protein